MSNPSYDKLSLRLAECDRKLAEDTLSDYAREQVVLLRAETEKQLNSVKDAMAGQVVTPGVSLEVSGLQTQVFNFQRQVNLLQETNSRLIDEKASLVEKLAATVAELTKAKQQIAAGFQSPIDATAAPTATDDELAEALS